MNPLCGWTQWRLSGAFDGKPPGRMARRHAARCPRCDGYYAGLDRWTSALRAGPPKNRMGSEEIRNRFLDAVRRAPAHEPTPHSTSTGTAPWMFRPAWAALALAVALLALSGPMTTRIRRHRAVRTLSKGSMEMVHLLHRIPAAFDPPLAIENDRFAQDISRALRFLAEGVPLRGALEVATLEDSGRY